MLLFNSEQKRFTPIPTSDLTVENILERGDLQRAAISSWNSFRKELEIPSAYLLGEEIKPHHSTLDSIDLLAFDQESNTIIIIEFKRNKNKLQLLQALSYAAMVNTWDNEKIIQTIPKNLDDYSELIESLQNEESDQYIQIILVAEQFDPEVVLTSEWLFSKHKVNISLFSISLHKHEDRIYFSFDKKFPIFEIDDIYVSRAKKTTHVDMTDFSWDDVIPKLTYHFGEKAIEICKKVKPGLPNRRRFNGIRRNFDGFNYFNIAFRNKHIHIHIGGFPEGGRKFIQSKFTTPPEINKWEKGYSFNIEHESQFNDLAEWLALK